MLSSTPMRLAYGLLLAAVVTLPGCIVASTPVYSSPDDCPPAFVANEALLVLSDGRPLPPIGDPALIACPTADTTAKVCDTSSPLELAATIPVRSCAVARTLEGRLFLDNRPVSQSILQPTGDVLRQVKFTISLQQMLLSCHKVEYFVTTQFASNGPNFHTPVKQGDLAYVVWLFDLSNGTVFHGLDTCPRTASDG
jgi:hypothetical protein